MQTYFMLFFFRNIMCIFKSINPKLRYMNTWNCADKNRAVLSFVTGNNPKISWAFVYLLLTSSFAILNDSNSFLHFQYQKQVERLFQLLHFEFFDSFFFLRLENFLHKSLLTANGKICLGSILKGRPRNPYHN